MGAIGGVVDFRKSNIDFSEFNTVRNAQVLRGRSGSVGYLDSGIGLFYNSDGVLKSEQPIFSERRGYKSSLVIDSFLCDVGFVMESYRTHGVEFVGMLNFPFSLALYDGERRMLILARDKKGKKPLYYSLMAGKVLFSSEPKGILSAKKENLRVDVNILSSYLTSPVGIYNASDIYMDIFEVRRGECILFTELGMSKFFYRENTEKKMSGRALFKFNDNIIEPFFDIESANIFSSLEDSLVAFDIPQFDIYMPSVCNVFSKADENNSVFRFADYLRRQNVSYSYERDDRFSAFYGKIGMGVMQKNDNQEYEQTEMQNQYILDVLLEAFFSLDKNDILFLRKIFGDTKMNCLLSFFDKKNIKKEDTALAARILGMIYQTIEWSKLRKLEFISEDKKIFSYAN